MSHWDISPEPSLLMEPFATTGLSDQADLTVDQYKDIGWFGTPGPCSFADVALAFFNAESRPDGVLLRWQLARSEEVLSVTVERAEDGAGPWDPVDVTLGREDEIVTGVDVGAEPGREYVYRLRVLEISGYSRTLGMVSGRRADGAAASVVLHAPRPNPTARGTTVAFRIWRPEYVRLAVVDVTGRAIRTLHDGMLPAGEHMLSWDGLTSVGTEAAPGVYLVSLRTSEGVRSRRLAVSH